jgi:large subunit ribosomal protein L6
MSRLAKKPIILPKGVEAKIAGLKLEVKGPKGLLNLELPVGLDVDITPEGIMFAVSEKSELEKPMLGLYRSLFNNNVLGVSQGFEKKLQLIGVGYRAAVNGNSVSLQLGFSHPCEVPIPSDIQVSIEKSTLITIKGVDKRLVGHFAALIRSKKPPEPYKGKGIRYVDEFVRKKAGKTAKGK